MAITNNYVPVKVSGDGVTLLFSFNFQIYATSDLLVTLINKVTGAVTATLSLGSDYSVAISSTTEGGTITCVVAPAATVWILIQSALEVDQPTSFTIDGKFSVSAVERALDRQCRLTQQLKDPVDRSVKIPASEASDGINLELPPLVAGKAIGIASDAKSLILLDADTGAAAAAAEAAAAAALISQTAAAASAAGASASAVAAAASAVAAAASAVSAIGAATIHAINLLILNNAGTPNSKYDVTADVIVMADGTGAPLRASAYSKTINCGVVGANGIDAGALGTNTLYAIWAIGKADGTVAGLISTSFTAPTMPAGYTYKMLLGQARTDGSSNFLKTHQQGRKFWYDATPAIYNSTPGSGAWVSVDTSTYISATLGKNIKAILGAGTSQEGLFSTDNSVSVATNANAPNRTQQTANTGLNPQDYVAGPILTVNTVYVCGSAAVVLYCVGFDITAW